MKFTNVYEMHYATGHSLFLQYECFIVCVCNNVLFNSRSRVRTEREERKIEGDLRRSQRACEQLDSQKVGRNYVCTTSIHAVFQISVFSTMRINKYQENSLILHRNKHLTYLDDSICKSKKLHL